jgi:HTH-type transcriptional regulator, competence development regulator
MKTIDEDAWIIQKADEEANAFVSVGVPSAFVDRPPALTPEAFATRVSFAKFVEFTRRRLRLTREQFSTRSKVPLEELVCIEEDDGFQTSPRTIYLLAEFLKISHMKLLALAGLAEAKDPGFNDAAVRFAAKSEPIRTLSREEQQALDEFVKFLSDK